MRVGIIGGGAAGLVAAGFCENAEVTLLERNEKVGKKLYITGKGRCNVTNNCALYEFFPKIVNGGKFLTSALTAFPPQSFMEYVSDGGVRLKTERGNRVFPTTDKASDIIKALAARAGKNAAIMTDVRVTAVRKEGDVFKVATSRGEFEFDRLIIATGGVSYKATGSTGDGYAFAKSFGHKIVSPVPALCGIRLASDVRTLDGLILRNVRATVTAGGKKFSEFGEMDFTERGVGGPIILTLSSYINRCALAGETLCIDMKPALSPNTLDERLVSDFGEMPNKDLVNILTSLLPSSVIPYVIAQSGVSPRVKGNSVTRDMRYALGFSVKNLAFPIAGLEDIDTAVVTSGGVELKEVDPKTMQSKLCKGLYFAGEILDTDALTGGFNIHCAAATGRAAGIAASGG